MTKEQKQDYLSKLDKDKAGAAMVIAFALASAKKTGAMIPDQLERYQEMQKELLLSAKTQKSIEILSAMPINRRCG